MDYKHEVIDMLLEKGYYFDSPLNSYDLEYDILHISNGMIFLERIEYFRFTEQYGKCINCDTNIDLFIEIASIRCDTDENQWFIEDIIRYGGIGGQIVGCEPFYKIGEKFIKSDNIHRITDYINDCKKNNCYCYIRRATPQEIYEDFQNNKL